MDKSGTFFKLNTIQKIVNLLLVDYNISKFYFNYYNKL